MLQLIKNKQFNGKGKYYLHKLTLKKQKQNHHNFQPKSSKKL